MTLEDLRIQRVIQGILVRNYVDTQKLEIQVIGQSVYIEGDFAVFDYHPSQKKEDRVERDLGVQRVIHPHEWEGRPDEVAWITQEFSRALEDAIRDGPEQYFWVHRRWKHRPDGTKAPGDGVSE